MKRAEQKMGGQRHSLEELLWLLEGRVSFTDFGLIHCHLPSFSYRHGMIPKLYVMPWKQDMKYRDLALKHAKLVDLYSGPLEDTLFLDKCERHCHGEDRKHLLQKVPYKLTVEDVPIYSHLSRYHKSMVAYGFRIRL